MSADEFITTAIEAGARDGVAALDETQRLVFLISEMEVLCDMGPGPEGFIEAYGTGGLLQAAEAFTSIGAEEIAAALRDLALSPTDEGRMERVTTPVTERAGYDYEAIQRTVEARLAPGSD